MNTATNSRVIGLLFVISILDALSPIGLIDDGTSNLQISKAQNIIACICLLIILLFALPFTIPKAYINGILFTHSFTNGLSSFEWYLLQFTESFVLVMGYYWLYLSVVRLRKRLMP